MDISNKTLAMFLVAAIVVSIAGTTISLNKLGQLGPTGLATTDIGNVTLTIGDTVSITVSDDDRIEFGTCNPLGGADVNISSDVNNGNATHTTCNGFTRDQINVRNDGNVDANVSANFSKYGELHGGSFLTSAKGSSNYWVNFSNSTDIGGYAGGCQDFDGIGGGGAGWVEITDTNYENVTVCQRLDAHATANSVGMDVKIQIPQGTAQGDYFEMTFFAWQSN